MKMEFQTALALGVLMLEGGLVLLGLLWALRKIGLLPRRIHGPNWGLDFFPPPGPPNSPPLPGPPGSAVRAKARRVWERYGELEAAGRKRMLSQVAEELPDSMAEEYGEGMLRHARWIRILQEYSREAPIWAMHSMLAEEAAEAEGAPRTAPEPPGQSGSGGEES